jgi:hypothetical protein
MRGSVTVSLASGAPAGSRPHKPAPCSTYGGLLSPGFLFHGYEFEVVLTSTDEFSFDVPWPEFGADHAPCFRRFRHFFSVST